MEDPKTAVPVTSATETAPIAVDRLAALKKLAAWRPVGKQRLALYGIGGIVVASLLAYSVFAYYQQRNRALECATDGCALNSNAPSRIDVLNNGDTSTAGTSPSLLNGLSLPTEKAAQRPLAVMIDNDTEARPQAGLGQADVVYEGLTEGGVTRFMALFADPAKAVRVGPVRSARTYFVDLATETNSFYAHVGGSADALTQLKQGGVKDLDQYVVGAPVYQRDFSRHVAVEHTVYSSTDKLWEYATKAKGLSSSASFLSWAFQGDADKAKRPSSQSISVSVSSDPFAVNWTYDPATNAYMRSMGGQPHTDANTGNQIGAKTVILQTVKRTTNDATAWSYVLDGSGKADINENGVTTKATWKKDALGRTRYYGDSGKEIQLVKGLIWIQMVQNDSKVSYTGA